MRIFWYEDLFPSCAPDRTPKAACALAGVPMPKNIRSVPEAYMQLLVAGVDHCHTGTYVWAQLCLEGAPKERRPVKSKDRRRR